MTRSVGGSIDFAFLPFVLAPAAALAAASFTRSMVARRSALGVGLFTCRVRVEACAERVGAWEEASSTLKPCTSASSSISSTPPATCGEQ